MDKRKTLVEFNKEAITLGARFSLEQLMRTCPSIPGARDCFLGGKQRRTFYVGLDAEGGKKSTMIFKENASKEFVYSGTERGGILEQL